MADDIMAGDRVAPESGLESAKLESAELKSVSDATLESVEDGDGGSAAAALEGGEANGTPFTHSLSVKISPHLETSA